MRRWRALWLFQVDDVAFGRRALRDCFSGGATGGLCPHPSRFAFFGDEAGWRSPGV